MQLKDACRSNVKIKMALQGPTGSGKTYGALLIAFGICGNWAKVGVIDTENHSSELFSHLGKFKTLSLEPPFTPERYIQAIQICEAANLEVIIIDSISHEWEGIGGILEMHGNMAGNGYTNWSKLTPFHNAFVQHFLQSPLHIIATIRSKQDYILVEKKGKLEPQKVGMKGITREGLDYEFTLVFELDVNNNASVSKDRTMLFNGKPPFKITPDTGKQIVAWCNEGEPPVQLNVAVRINECKSIDELLKLFYDQPPKDTDQKNQFSKRRAELEQKTVPPELLINLIPQTNGTINGSQK